MEEILRGVKGVAFMAVLAVETAWSSVLNLFFFNNKRQLSEAGSANFLITITGYFQ
jgi:hypothetical protein